jgi:hypothetical protein
LVLAVRSQIKQNTERFILQAGLFKFYHETRCSTGRFFSF